MRNLSSDSQYSRQNTIVYCQYNCTGIYKVLLLFKLTLRRFQYPLAVNIKREIVKNSASHTRNFSAVDSVRENPFCVKKNINDKKICRYETRDEFETFFEIRTPALNRFRDRSARNESFIRSFNVTTIFLGQITRFR